MDKDTHNAKIDQATDSRLLRKIDREKGYRKAAEFILLLDREAAGRVLALLNEEEVIGIIQEIAVIRKIDPREAERVLKEYGLDAQPRSASREVAGGLSKAEEILNAAFDKDTARSVLGKVEDRLLPHQFDFLTDVDDEKLATLLADESPQVISLVLTQTAPVIASRLLVKLPQEVQKEVAKRIGKMATVHPEVIRQTADALKKKLFADSDLSTEYIDGKKALREILKRMEVGEERTILNSLAEEKPELAEELEKALFTMDMLMKIPRRQMHLFLRELSDRVIALILKGE